jgi:hypothetical protein
VADIKHSIWNHQKAIQFTEDGHPAKSSRLSNLGTSHLGRFERFGELSDLESAMSHFHDAVQLTDKHHPDQANCLSGLGLAHRLRFKRLGESTDLVASISAFQTAAMSKVAYPRDALRAARFWADLAYHHGDISSALDGYRTALEILPRVAWLGLSTTSRQNWLFQENTEDLNEQLCDHQVR